MKTRKLHTAVIAFLAFAVTTLAQTVPSYVPTNGLVGYWGFNGNANDESGNGNNGTVNGATLTTDRNGNANGAYSFGGVGFIDVPNSSTLQINSGGITISQWVYITGNSNIYCTISKEWDYIPGFYGTYFFRNTNGTYHPSFYVREFANGLTIPGGVDSSQDLNINQWYLVTGTYDFNTIKIYINGVLTGSVSSNVPMLTNSGSLRIGSSGFSYWFKDKLDDIAIYNRALTQAEITQLYTATSSVQTLCAKTIQPYNVNVGDAAHDGSTYVWSISPATPSAVMTGNGTNAITIDWTNVPYGSYTLQTVETNTAGCLSTPVNATINLTQPTAAPSAPATQTFCTAATVANLTATGTNLQWFTTAIGGTALTATTALTTGNYYVSQTVGLCESNRTVVAVSVNPTVTPAFAQVAPICSGGTLASLPTTSNNGITGTWLPAINNTATTTYTFTPTANQCAETSTMTIVVNPNVTPTFTQVAPVCSGGILASLPTTSNNGISGIWLPAINNTATTAYTFTPTAGLCATTTAMTIVVNPSVTPTFTQVAPVCSGGILSPLPTTSNNGITGTWLPAINNTATTTYTFTPTAGLCATTTAMTIVVNPNVTPTFTQISPVCSGTTLTALPTTSNNGITGTWLPAVNPNITTTYTFTPTAGQCASTTTQTIIITAPVVTSAISFVAPVQQLSVGMSYGGGKIIYIFQPGDAGYINGQTHGLIIAIGSITTTNTGNNCGSYFSTFGCSGVFNGNTSTAMGTGISNTNQLVASCGAGTVASICDSLVENGYSDWFLPSKDELSKVYQNYSLVGGVYPTASQGVWSSSEVNANSGYVCSFDGGGGWVVLPKTYGFCVKPLRKF